MQLPIRLDATDSRSLQEQLFERLVRLVADGRLKPGMQMPATRQLAIDLGVSRNTVVLAYERLTAEGFIEMRPPHGTFVCPYAPVLAVPPARDAPAERASAQRAVERAPIRFAGSMHALNSPHAGRLEFDFWVGRPDARLFPAQAWRKLVEQSLASMQHGDGSYGDPAGLAVLRSAIAAHLGAGRGIACTADDVIVTNGIQEGINIVARLLLAPGVAVGIESPGYLGAANVFASHGARLLPVEVDEEGAVPEGLPPDCRLLYVTPAHQYPSGVAMSPWRREAWLRWAQRSGGYLIEDDYDSDFYFDGAPLPAVKAADEHGSVIYLGTFSKSLAAGLRVGYMVLPRQLRESAAVVKGLATNGSSWLAQAALATFLNSGEYAHHLRRLRKLYAARRDALRTALKRHFGDASLSGDHAGMHALWRLPFEQPRARQIEQSAAALGVGVYSLASANAWLHGVGEERRQQHLMLGYAALDEREIDAGIARLASIVVARPSLVA